MTVAFVRPSNFHLVTHMNSFAVRRKVRVSFPILMMGRLKYSVQLCVRE